MTTKPQGLTRRKFLGQASCAAVGSIALLNTLLNLRLMSSAAAQGTGGAYKGLVCLFLSGGNDSFNMLVPSDADHYLEYQLIRGGLHNATTDSGGLALPNVGASGGLLPISPLGNLGGRQFGLHPAMGRLHGLFESGQAAFVSNVGSLIQPGMTRAMHDAGINVPFGLYSHADQIEQWQTAYPEGRTTIGWAGRAADLLQSMNTANGLSMNISLGGTNLWQTGNSVIQYGLNPGGVRDLDGYDIHWDQAAWGLSPIRGAAVDSQLSMDYQNLLEKTFVNKTRNAIEAYQVFQEATSLPLPENVTGFAWWPARLPDARCLARSGRRFLFSWGGGIIMTKSSTTSRSCWGRSVMRWELFMTPSRRWGFVIRWQPSRLPTSGEHSPRTDAAPIMPGAGTILWWEVACKDAGCLVNTRNCMPKIPSTPAEDG